MEVKVEKLYLNIEAGLLYRTTSVEPLKLTSCVGKKVEVENLEFNFVIIDGVYYESIGWYQGLCQLGVVSKDEAIKRTMMVPYLVSLVGPLMGYYIEVRAKNEDCVRRWAAAKLHGMWCSVYPRDYSFVREPKLIDGVQRIGNYGEDI